VKEYVKGTNIALPLMVLLNIINLLLPSPGVLSRAQGRGSSRPLCWPIEGYYEGTIAYLCSNYFYDHRLMFPITSDGQYKG
jgi:hypothetical protein